MGIGTFLFLYFGPILAFSALWELFGKALDAYGKYQLKEQQKPDVDF
jgi:hypothetical protein